MRGKEQEAERGMPWMGEGREGRVGCGEEGERGREGVREGGERGGGDKDTRRLDMT
jgi:hypothetical protein